MNYEFSFRPYQRQFHQPLQTHHGVWKTREGIILRLEDDLGNIGWGEIAPLPWFGSETLAQAMSFCQGLSHKITPSEIFAIPDSLPACQFGFESALDRVIGYTPCSFTDITYSYLLPTGETVLHKWQNIWEKAKETQQTDAITFKWKIGVNSLAVELNIFEKLRQLLPIGSKLRLDANGGLNVEETRTWLKIADESDIVEFIEQPLSPSQLTTMLHLSANYSTPLALDESVATLKQLVDCYEKGWKGIFVIKPAIVGSPRLLREFLQLNPIDAVFSSVLETDIARQAALNLAVELNKSKRAVGFGVEQWFEKGAF